MRRLICLAVFLLTSYAAPVWAQANACDPTPAARLVRFQPAVTTLAFTAPSHTATDVDGAPLVTEYQGEVLLNGAPVTNWTIPKTALTLQAGTPANCYLMPIPGMSGLLPQNTYRLRITQRRVNESVGTVLSTDSFFLPGVAGSLGAIRLATPPTTP